MRFPSRQWWSWFGLALVVALAGLQLVPYGRDHVNPPTIDEPAWDSPETRALAKQACFDCHSNETEWPPYAALAPASWLIQRDVTEGRAKLNFSEWQRPQEEAEEAADEVRERKMPPAIYKLMHGHARLSQADHDRLVRGLATTFGAPPERNTGDEH